MEDDPQLEEYRERMRTRPSQPTSSQPQGESVPPVYQEYRPLIPQAARGKAAESCLPDSSECLGVKSSHCVLSIAAILTVMIVALLVLLLFL